MGFTVARAGGTKDSEFEAYARLLRQQGVDLGKLPRVPEPGTNRRWLYVWDSSEKAQAFADELRKRTRDSAWQVTPVTAPPSEGPMGPILIQLARRSDGLIFSIHSLSRAMLRSAYPSALGANTVSIDTERWNEFRKNQGALADLVAEIAPALSGLTRDELTALGYAVIDDESEETLAFVPPAEAAGS